MVAKPYDPDLWAKKYVEQQIPGVDVFFKIPKALTRGIRVEAIGGQPPAESFHSPAVMVEAWDSSRASARDLMTSLADAFTAAPGVVIDGWLCVGTESLSDPYQSPDDDHPGLTFYRCTVRILLRRA